MGLKSEERRENIFVFYGNNKNNYAVLEKRKRQPKKVKVNFKAWKN